MNRVVHPDFLPIPDPGVKKAPDPGSGTLVHINFWSAGSGPQWECRSRREKITNNRKNSEISCFEVLDDSHAAWTSFMEI
jgi:hypothetical protein